MIQTQDHEMSIDPGSQNLFWVFWKTLFIYVVPKAERICTIKLQTKSLFCLFAYTQ